MISMIFRKGNVSTAKDVLTNKNDSIKYTQYKPIYLKNYEADWYLNCQKAFLNIDKGLVSQVKDALNTVKSYFQKSSPLFQSEVYAKLTRTKILGNCTPDNAVWNMIGNVPIYLVTKDMEETDPTIPSSITKAPVISDIDENIDPFKDPISVSFEEGTPLGCYEYSANVFPKSLKSLGETRRIFLWIDNIYAEAKEFKLNFGNFFAYVLVHELTHALLDVYNEKIMADNKQVPHKTVFRLHREESIAEGFALYFTKQTDSVFAQTLQGYMQQETASAYQLGLAFYEEDVLKAAIHNWMSIKSGRPITKDAARTWLINSKKFLNSKAEVIINYDNALYNSAQTNP